MAKKPRLPTLLPGEILREEFMAPLNLSANHLAKELRVPATRITDLIREASRHTGHSCPVGAVL